VRYGGRSCKGILIGFAGYRGIGLINDIESKEVQNMAVEINFMVGGEAGQGVQTIGFALAKTLSRAGLHVFADQDYESRVKGGHNFYRVRAGESEIQALSEQLDVLIAIDQNTVELHHAELKSNGIAIFDQDKLSTQGKKLNSLSIPLEKLAEEKTSNKLMANSVAVGAAIAVGGYEFELLEQVLREHFDHLGKTIVDNNVRAARAGYEHAQQHPEALRQRIKVDNSGKKMMLLNGNEAIALGAMAAGCKFMAAYPMTPASSIMEYIADKGRRFNIVMIQPEDEIAAINMAVGAGFVGVRAMTATSGDGFALMTEGLGLAGITETPVVIIIAQRPGPAVGLPTRTEQGELSFAIYGGSGEFPRAVLAPCTIEDAFHMTVKAFNLAEKYQLPVILLTDHHLASSYQTLERFDLGKVTIDRGQLISEEEASKITEYKRHRFTESGISPRLIPMRGKTLVVTDSDEHDEAGHMIEDAQIRSQMMLKRLRKIDIMEKGLTAPWSQRKPKAEATLVGWGSTYGAIKEAASLLENDGLKINMLQLNELWPFPAQAVTSVLHDAKKCIVIENNATGQLAHLIRAETGIKASGNILKYDGRPFSPSYIANELKKEVAKP
jgi:2-oxoglutarate ferredoxin oxidoreductase subunit alpha